MPASTQYRNPVLRGFNPDPSVLKFGDRFYLAVSSFEYFPGIPLYESKDLVHWRAIGHIINRDNQLDLRGINDSHGIWAPDISYHDGLFYCFATLRLNGLAAEAPKRLIRRQLVFTARNIYGPWSDPDFIDIDGIDPSHFIDDDGQHYMCLEPGLRLIPLSDDGRRAIGPPKTIWPGTGARCPEGPHLFKRAGWYYAILAEGGTGYGHRISVARSRSLYGPYEASPYNPVMTQTDPAAPIQRAGHGKLVEASDGTWWCLYLCGRPNDGQYTTLGRESALDPVTWTNDDWFLINNGRGPSLVQQAPTFITNRHGQGSSPIATENLTETSDPNGPMDEDFGTRKLSPLWLWCRNPRPGAWSLSSRGLSLYAGNQALGSIHIDNLLLRRETELAYEAETICRFQPEQPREEAGLVCYLAVANWIACVISRRDDGSPLGGEPIIRLKLCRNAEPIVIAEAGLPTKTSTKPTIPPIVIKLVVRGQRREFFWALAGRDLKPLGTIDDCRFLSGEMVSAGKAHTGCLVGLYASNGGTGRRAVARFRRFIYQPVTDIP